MGKPRLLDLPITQPRNGHDCGPAVARSVLRHFGRSVAGVDRVLKPCPVDGTPPERLAGLFVRTGLGVAMREKLTVADLGELTRAFGPVLCPVTIKDHTGQDEGHWVAVRGVQAGRVHQFSPGPGLIDTPAADFLASWRDSLGDGTKLTRFGLIVWGY